MTRITESVPLMAGTALGMAKAPARAEHAEAVNGLVGIILAWMPCDRVEPEVVACLP